MTPQEVEQIKKWQTSNTTEISLRLILTGHEQDLPFTSFCEDLTRLAPRIVLKKETDETTSIPGIRIGERITYQAIPLGLELPPFLAALGPEKPAAVISEALRLTLDRLVLPVFLKLFIAPHCPFCPATVDRMISLAESNRLIRLSIIDGALFPDIAAEDRIQSAPTLILDRFRWSGSIELSEVVRIMVDRDPADLGGDTLQSILQGGGASQVAGMLRDARKIFPAFLTLLTHPRWTVRLGAMVVMEELIESDIHLARQAAQRLREKFHEWDDSVRGDMIYLLGEIGDPEVLPLLEGVLGETRNSDVAAAATEAIQSIRLKTGVPFGSGHSPCGHGA